MIKVTRGHDCLVVSVTIGDNSYRVTASDDVPARQAIDMLMDQIVSRELGITSHDIWMAVADFMVRQ